MTDAERFTLLEMLDWSREAVELLGARDENDLGADRVRELAVAKAVEQIGECSQALGDAFKRRYPFVAWRQAAALRNRLVHAYRTIILQIVVDVIREDLPVLIRDLENILAEGNSPS